MSDTSPTSSISPPLRAAQRLRAATSGLGLQGRVVFCFVALLTLSLGATVYMFVRHTRGQLSDLMGVQARQMAASLALAKEQSVGLRHREDLARIGRELIKSRNVLFVAFLDDEANPISVASRDPDVDLKNVCEVKSSTSLLLRVREARSALFGDYVETVAPVLSDGGGESRLLGYVAVGVSQEGEAARLGEITRAVVVIALLTLALSIMVASVLVHRLFLPIRTLVAATHKIISGDLDTRVELDRTDAIGALARAFNEMVMWVKQQQRDLAAVNQKLLESNRDLEEKVAQRTAQLETANSRLSSEIAEKEAFLRAVSHDLNAPLRNIDGLATMLLARHSEKLDPDIVHRLERIKKNVELQSGLIAELLELSRIKSRRGKLELVDLEALIGDLREMFAEDLRARSIELIIEGPLPVLECERARMGQVFQNLIDNAIKYMGPASGRPREIRIGCEVKLTEAEFFVRDTGIGIDPEDIERVFQVFRRGKNSMEAQVEGKGVGLASVRSIIETYNGRIWVESKLGEGSTFRFTINGKYVPSAGKAQRATPAMRATAA